MDNQDQPGAELLHQRWEQRLEQAGLGELMRALKQGLKPLQPLAAQFLWFAQPGFALFGQAAAIDALASTLADDGDPSPDHIQHG